MKNALKCAFKAWMKEAKECQEPDEYIGWQWCMSMSMLIIIVDWIFDHCADWILLACAD